MHQGPIVSRPDKCQKSNQQLEFFAAKPARSQAVAPPRRLVIYFLPNGRMPKTWVPAELGNAFTLPTALRMSQSARDQI